MRSRDAAPATAFLAAGLVAIAFALGIYGPAARGSDTAMWSGTIVQASEVERYASLEEMTASADAVVRGRIVSLEPGRTFGDPAGEALHYAAATLRVEQWLGGALPSRDATELTLEIPLFDGPAGMGPMRSGLPGDESIFFLRNKGESARTAGLPRQEQLAEAGFWRLVVFRGVIMNVDGRAAVIPGETDFVAALDGLPFEQVLRAVMRAAAQTGPSQRDEVSVGSAE